MTVARGASTIITSATVLSTCSHPGEPPVQTVTGVVLGVEETGTEETGTEETGTEETDTGPLAHPWPETASPPSAAGSARPPGMTSVPISLSRTVQRAELHSSATPTNQPSTGMMIP